MALAPSFVHNWHLPQAILLWKLRIQPWSVGTDGFIHIQKTNKQTTKILCKSQASILSLYLKYIYFLRGKRDGFSPVVYSPNAKTRNWKSIQASCLGSRDWNTWVSTIVYQDWLSRKLKPTEVLGLELYYWMQTSQMVACPLPQIPAVFILLSPYFIPWFEMRRKNFSHYITRPLWLSSILGSLLQKVPTLFFTALIVLTAITLPVSPCGFAVENWSFYPSIFFKYRSSPPLRPVSLHPRLWITGSKALSTHCTSLCHSSWTFSEFSSDSLKRNLPK